MCARAYSGPSAITWAVADELSFCFRDHVRDEVDRVLKGHTEAEPGHGDSIDAVAAVVLGTEGTQAVGKHGVIDDGVDELGHFRVGHDQADVDGLSIFGANGPP
jgi:hypothetical protein